MPPLGLCQIVYSHKQDLTRTGGPLSNYFQEDLTSDNYSRFMESLNDINLAFDVTAEQMAGSSRTFLLLLAHLYLNLPSLLPKVLYCTELYSTLLPVMYCTACHVMYYLSCHVMLCYVIE